MSRFRIIRAKGVQMFKFTAVIRAVAGFFNICWIYCRWMYFFSLPFPHNGEELKILQPVIDEYLNSTAGLINSKREKVRIAKSRLQELIGHSGLINRNEKEIERAMEDFRGARYTLRSWEAHFAHEWLVAKKVGFDVLPSPEDYCHS